MIRHLASLLMNTDSLNKPISPLHTPFADFPRNKSRSGEYHLDGEEVDKYILHSVALMSREGSLDSTSATFRPLIQLNREIENIDPFIKMNISAQLLYAC